jgi:hypothetical protein
VNCGIYEIVSHFNRVFSFEAVFFYKFGYNNFCLNSGQILTDAVSLSSSEWNESVRLSIWVLQPSLRLKFRRVLEKLSFVVVDNRMNVH